LPIYFLKGINKYIKASQFDKNDIDALGFLKFDMLGLKTLSVLKDIKSKLGISKNFDEISYEDPNVLSIIRNANTNGIFQLESDGIKNLIRKLKPKNFNEIVSLISLYRPGPIDLISDYCERKKNFKSINYLNKNFKNILEETYGLIIFQEQIIKIIEECTKCDFNFSEKIRKSILKSTKFNIRKTRAKFKKNIKKKI